MGFFGIALETVIYTSLIMLTVISGLGLIAISLSALLLISEEGRRKLDWQNFTIHFIFMFVVFTGSLSILRSLGAFAQ